MAKAFRSKVNRNYTDPNKPRYAELNWIKQKFTRANTIKIISYNIKFSKRIQQAIHLINKSDELNDADIFCLQEMDPKGVKQIAKALSCNYVYYPATKYHKDFGNAILSRWPILNDKKIILPFQDPDKLQRIVVKATVLINGKKVIVFCIHMKVFMTPYERGAQLENFLKHAIPSSNKLAIVAGDFNTFSQRSRQVTNTVFHKAHFELASKGVGWTFRHWYLAYKKSALDHIYTKGMKVIHRGKVINRSPSDHLPLWAEVSF